MVALKSRRLALLDKGSRGERNRVVDKLDNNKWDYFPSSNKEECNYNRLLPTVA